MGWFSNAGDNALESFNTLPAVFRTGAKVTLWSGFLVVVLSILLDIAMEPLMRVLPASEDSVASAQRKVEIERKKIEKDDLLSESSRARRVAEAQADAKVELQRAQVEAQRATLGLPAKTEKEGPGALAALVKIATDHLPTILAIMFAAYLLPTFASTGDPWRLALNIAAAIVLSGLFALIRGVTSPSAVELKGSIGQVSVSSASVGLCLMLFGMLLAGFCLHKMNNKKD